MSPRKSSTSSADPSTRPRYLAIEVAGEPIPPRLLERELTRRLAEAGGHGEVRLIRAEGRRALVRVDHRDLPIARGAWNVGRGVAAPAAAVGLRTVRSYGTLRKGKIWIRRPTTPGAGRTVDEAPRRGPPV